MLLKRRRSQIECRKSVALPEQRTCALKEWNANVLASQIKNGRRLQGASEGFVL
jgi:hypothetical protein